MSRTNHPNANQVTHQEKAQEKIKAFRNITQYTSKKDLINLFRELWDCENVSEDQVIECMFYIRDPRKGKGLVKSFFIILNCLLREVGTEIFPQVAQHFEEFGCFKDYLRCLELSGCNLDIRKQISQKIAYQLYQDKYHYLNKEMSGVSLMAKWAPTENSSYDRRFGIVKFICDEMKITKKIYRKEFLVPLRDALDIVEHKISSGKWDQIDFEKMPKGALRRYQTLFQKYCPDLYNEYKRNLELKELKELLETLI